MLKFLIRYFLENRLISMILLLIFIIWGIICSPFNFNINFLPRDPISVDAIPDIGENQQIIATEWMGRSPKDVEDQITYPLTSALIGVPGVKTIRSTSMFGMSFIYIIFKDEIDFYWSRSRILEKLNSLPSGTLPQGVQPTLGPDATALGQIFWYTLEGRNTKTGKPAGGWSPQELRTIQDFYVKYSLSSADGVSEVASIGGYIKEYEVDVNPYLMKSFGVSMMEVMEAVKKSNIDIGAETIELNKVEYVVRGLGYIKNLDDLSKAVIKVNNGVPVRVGDVSKVLFGPATRRGGLDKSGSEAVGAVVVARYGSNPMEVINNIKQKISEVSNALPSKTLADGTVSKVTIVPFYDRSELIKETIGTLESSLSHEILISIIVIVLLLFNIRASLIVSFLLPVAVLMTFIAMKLFNIEANIVALSGIAIAIGVMVDMGIVDIENVNRHLEKEGNLKGKQLIKLIFDANIEVRAAVTVALATTIVSFIPVFTMQAAEGKLFHPLAFTKTIALLSSFVLGIIVLPTLAYYLYSIKFDKKSFSKYWNIALIVVGLFLMFFFKTYTAFALILIAVNNFFEYKWTEKYKNYPNLINIVITSLIIIYYLTYEWLPLGAHNSIFVNYLFVVLVLLVVLVPLALVIKYYTNILNWCLNNKIKFFLIPFIAILLAITIWFGFNKTFGFIPYATNKVGLDIKNTAFWSKSNKTFPGLGKEFMPALDEGSFLLMPTSMPNTGIEQNINYIKLLDKRLNNIPEVDVSVGKWGRVNSALDPAPVQMFENTINYKPEYVLDNNGHRRRFKVNDDDNYVLKNGKSFNLSVDGYANIDTSLLIVDDNGEYLRLWRPEIKSPDDIWNEIVKVTQLPGLTSAPKLQPIQTRLIMLSTGMRAPMGLKILGPDLETIEKAGLQFEKILKQVDGVVPSSVFYDRAVGAPYIEIKLKREELSKYGIKVNEVQELLQSAVGGMSITNTVEGRERFPVRVRYARELRNSPEEIKNILVQTQTGAQIPLSEITEIDYVKGPQMIKSENTFLNGYVIFDKTSNVSEVDVVEKANDFIQSKIESGELALPQGVSYKFAGNYEQELRASKRLLIVIPVSLIIVFLLLFFQFKTITASTIHFSGVFVAFAGGFIMIWLYSQPWFLNFSLAGVNLRDLFHVHTINLSVAIWVGFIALFGIATNDGVIMGTYIHQVFEKNNPASVLEVRNSVIEAGKKRVRPALMTAACAIIALLPILTSTGKGSDIMIPMAIPTFGGMIIQIMTIFIVPVLQCIWRENVIKSNLKRLNK